MNTKELAIGAGVGIVVVTHVPMLLGYLTMSTLMERQIHATANLIAVGLITFGHYS
jgi:hypothetical protein